MKFLITFLLLDIILNLGEETIGNRDIDMNTPVGVNAPGRMPILDKIAKTEAIAAIEARCREGVGFAMVGSFAKFLEPYTRATMRRFNVIDWETKKIPYSSQSYRHLYTEICSVKARQGG